MFDNASPLEIVWTLITGVGFLVCMYLFFQANADKRVVDGTRDPSPIRLRKARANRRSELTKAVLLLSFMLLGVVSMFTPEAVRPAVNFFFVAVSWTFILGTVFVVADSLLCLAERNQNMRERMKEHTRFMESDEVVVEVPSGDNTNERD